MDRSAAIQHSYMPSTLLARGYNNGGRELRLSSCCDSGSNGLKGGIEDSRVESIPLPLR